LRSNHSGAWLPKQDLIHVPKQDLIHLIHVPKQDLIQGANQGSYMIDPGEDMYEVTNGQIDHERTNKQTNE